jgi:hypothetical protein
MKHHHHDRHLHHPRPRHLIIYEISAYQRNSSINGDDLIIAHVKSN